MLVGWVTFAAPSLAVEPMTVGPGLLASGERWALREVEPPGDGSSAPPRVEAFGASPWRSIVPPRWASSAAIVDDPVRQSAEPPPRAMVTAHAATLESSPPLVPEEQRSEAREDARDDAKAATALERLRPEVRVAARINTTVQGDRRDRLDGYRFDTLLLLPRFTGRLTKHIGWQLGFFSRATEFGQAEVRVLDVVAELDLAPPIRLWAGRFVAPADRSNLSGPFLIPAWNYPGVYGGALVIAPQTGPVGRDTGAVLWGEVGGGRWKYYAAVQGLEDRGELPRMTARTNVAIIGAEPGYYNAGGYLGKRDVLAVGGSMQYQPSGERLVADPEDPTATDQILGDLWIANVDLIAEKNLGKGGTPTLEASYHAFDAFRPYRHAYFVSGAYLLPWQIGPGGLQTAVRWQQAFPRAAGAGGLAGVDVAATYLFAGYRARLAVVFQHQSLGDGGPRWNALNIGFQFIAG